MILDEARPLFSMLGDPRPGHGLIGVSDPDVHLRDGRWTMFLGAFTTRFVVRIVEARQPAGAGIADDRWKFVTGRRGRAVELGAPSGRREWDAAGMHTPSFVRGPGVDRIYYAGRMTKAFGGTGSRYAIGYLEWDGEVWRRGPGPVLHGDAERPSALEPFVRYDDGRWRMWFLSAVGEVGPGEQPDYELRYTESDDGRHWAAPEYFAATFFDNTVTDDGTMILARGTNLYGTRPYPEQGLWISRGGSVPQRLLDTDAHSEPWYAAGVCGPAAVIEGDRMHIFATGTHAPLTWWRAALGRLRKGRTPPAPAPFFLTTGRFSYRLSR